MADSITVRVDGLQQLGERMRNLSEAVNKKNSQEAVNAGAQVIKKQAIANAPQYPKQHRNEYGQEVPPGTLKHNIVVKKVTRTNMTAEAIVTVRGKRKDLYAARFGRIVEYGSVKMAPEPYMRLAFEQKKEAAVVRIKQVLTSKIEKAENAR